MPEKIEKKYKIAIIAPVPFYYHIPLYRKLAGCGKIDLSVYYCSDQTLHGVEVERLYRANGRLASDDLLEGYKYKFLKNYSPSPSFMTWPFGLINFSVWREIKNGDFDAVVLHSWTNITWWLAYLACLRFHSSVFFTTDSNIQSEQLSSGLKIKIKKILLEKFIFKMAAGILISGTANEQFYKYYGVPDKKMARLSHWWGFEKLILKAGELKNKRENSREFFGIKKTDLVLLFVGRLAEEKNLYTLLDAYSRVAYENKKLFIAGDGPLRTVIEKYIADNKIKGVRLAGFQSRENIVNYYNVADIFVLPSIKEPWGMVVNEAMCFGLPVIASDRVGSAVDLVKDGYNGFIFQAKNTEQLAMQIEHIAQLDFADRKVFGARSLEIISRWIDDSDIEKRLPEILKLIKKRK